MKNIIKSMLIASSVAAFSMPTMAQSSLDQLLEQVKANRVSEAKINQQREAEFMSARADKQDLLNKAPRCT